MSLKRQCEPSQRWGKQTWEEGKALQAPLTAFQSWFSHCLDFFSEKDKSRTEVTFLGVSHLNAHRSVSLMLWILQWLPNVQFWSLSPLRQHTQCSTSLCLPSNSFSATLCLVCSAITMRNSIKMHHPTIPTGKGMKFYLRTTFLLQNLTWNK